MTQGRLIQVHTNESSITVNGDEVKIYSQESPPDHRKQHDGDVVLRSRSFFTDKDKAAAHLTASASKVVISAPASTGSLKTINLNVNHDIDGSETIISCASAPLTAWRPSGQDAPVTDSVSSGRLMTTIRTGN